MVSFLHVTFQENFSILRQFKNTLMITSLSTNVLWISCHQKKLIIYLSPIQSTVYMYAIECIFFMHIIFGVNLVYTKLSVRISSVFYHTFHTYFFIYISVQGIGRYGGSCHGAINRLPDWLGVMWPQGPRGAIVTERLDHGRWIKKLSK